MPILEKEKVGEPKTVKPRKKRVAKPVASDTDTEDTAVKSVGSIVKKPVVKKAKKAVAKTVEKPVEKTDAVPKKEAPIATKPAGILEHTEPAPAAAMTEIERNIRRGQKITPTSTESVNAVPFNKKSKPVLDEIDLKEAAEEYIRNKTEETPMVPAIKYNPPAVEITPPPVEITAPRSSVPPIQEMHKVRPIGLYKKIAYLFGFLTLALVAAVAYFAFVKIDIMLIPNQERVSNNLVFDVYDTVKNPSVKQESITGVVGEVAVTETKKYVPSGSEIIGEEVAGKITISNNYNRSQTLVATTRLLSADNKLFRMKKTVNIPAGESLEVDVYADKPAQDMAVADAMKWTIPGLWAGLQDKIYGENKAPLVYQKQIKRTISQTDIDDAVNDLKSALLAKTKTDLAVTYKDYSHVLSDIDKNAVVVTVDGKAGEEREDFTVNIKTNVRVVAFKDGQVVAMAKEKISSTIPEKKELINFDSGKIVYSLNSYNSEQGVASVNATFEGKITLKPDAVIVEKEKIVGLNKDQLNEYLSSLPELAGFATVFSPPFITKVPDLVDRINIEIKK